MTWTFLGHAVFSASQWLVLAWITRKGGTASAGVYAYAVAISAPFFSFTELQLRIHYVSEQGDRDQFTHYLHLRFLSGGLAFLLVAVYGMATLGMGFIWTGLLILALSRWIQSISDICLAIPHAAGQLDVCGRSIFLKGVLGVVASLVLYHWLGAMGAILGWLVSRGLTYLLFDRPLAGVSLFRSLAAIRWNAVLSLGKRTASLGVVMGLVAMNAALPIFFLDRWSSKDAIGIFSAIQVFGLIIGMFVNGVAQNVAPKLSAAFHAGHRARFHRILLGFAAANLAVGVALLLGSWAAGSNLLGLIYGPTLATQGYLLTMSLVASLLGSLASVLGCGMTGGRQYAVQIPLLLLVLVVGSLAHALLVPSRGAVGAMYALIVMQCIQILCSWLVLSRNRGWAR